MAASHTLPHPFTIPQISWIGVLTLYGYGIRVRMQAGHLEIEDGIGPQRYKLRLPRVNHRLKRLVCIGDDGFITLSALRWLSDVGASFIMLDRLGKVRVVTGPAAPSEARLRRAQALALSNGTALAIALELIAAKLNGQETLVREKLNDSAAGDSIRRLRENLASADNLNAVRLIESRGASLYWGAWSDVPILFPRKDQTLVPSHWLRFASRHSPLTGGPRLAVNPANALLNFLNAIGESECRLAAVACGLDPGLGLLHTDTANRDSLALDLIEPVRPAIEAWLLDWLLNEPLRRSDFLESSDGNCRICSGLCSRLSETALTWRKLIAPWAEFVVHSLWGGRLSRPHFAGEFKTPLTQSHRREVKGVPMPLVKMPEREHMCRDCGAPAPHGRHCLKCGRELASKSMTELSKLGRIAAQRADAQRKRSETQLRHKAAQKQWRLTPKSNQINEEFYRERIQPRLASVALSEIASELEISIPYAADIRAGRRIPHPRHWQTLAESASLRH